VSSERDFSRDLLQCDKIKISLVISDSFSFISYKSCWFVNWSLISPVPDLWGLYPAWPGRALCRLTWEGSIPPDLGGLYAGWPGRALCRLTREGSMSPNLWGLYAAWSVLWSHSLIEQVGLFSSDSDCCNNAKLQVALDESIVLSGSKINHVCKETKLNNLERGLETIVLFNISGSHWLYVWRSGLTILAKSESKNNHYCPYSFQ